MKKSCSTERDKGKHVMKKQSYYCADGWIKWSEENSWGDGCIHGTDGEGSGSDQFRGKTVTELIGRCMEFVGTADPNEVLLDSCGEVGRLDIQVFEDLAGTVASDAQFELWRQGKLRMWLSTYTFSVVRRTDSPVVLRRLRNSGNYSR